MPGYLDRSCCDDLQTQINALAADVAAAQASASAANTLISALVNADTEGFPWPFDGDVPPWELRIPDQPEAGVFCNSKNDLVYWTRHELPMKVRTQAVVRVADTISRPGIPIRIYWVVGNAARVLIGTATSAGTGATQDLVIPLVPNVQGPGTFIFEATTPNPAGASGSYTISRYRIS